MLKGGEHFKMTHLKVIALDRVLLRGIEWLFWGICNLMEMKKGECRILMVFPKFT